MITIKTFADGTARIASSKEAEIVRLPQVYQNRHDWKTFSEAERVAEMLNKYYDTDRIFVATDAGECESPRYDVVEVPKVGDKVSAAFNGDYYPCGKVESVSPTFKKITTTDGKAFYRRKLSGAWKCGHQYLVQGHISELNPHF